MDEEVFNTSVRKFLKKVGITSQQEIETAVREAIASGRLKGDESLSVRVLLEFEPRAQPLEIDGHIDLR